MKIVCALLVALLLLGTNSFAEVTQADLNELNSLRIDTEENYISIVDSMRKIQRIFNYYHTGLVSGITLTAEQKATLKQEALDLAPSIPNGAWKTKATWIFQEWQ